MFQYVNINNEPIELIQPADAILLYEIKNQGAGTLTPKVIKNFNVVNFSGFKTLHYNDQLYNNIHIIKNNYDLGYVSEYTEENIEVWNSYYTYKSLESVIKSSDDFDLYTDETLPFTIRDNYSLNYTLKIPKDGETIINENIIFNIDSRNINVEISGIRASLFDYYHSYINDFKEKYSFYTSIMSSINLNEQRMPLIEDCNYSCEYTYRLKDENKQKMDAILYNNINSLIALPLYNNIRKVEGINNKTINLDLKNSVFQKNMQILIKDVNNKEIATIESIDLLNNNIIIKKNLINNYFNPNIIPVILTRTSSVSSQNSTPFLTDYSITFEKEIDEVNMLNVNNEIEIETIEDVNYIINLPNYNININKDYNFNNTILTNEYGIKAFYEYNKTSEISFSYEHLFFDKNKLSKLKKIFNNNKGSYGDLYINNYSNDLKINDNIYNNDIIIKIKNIGASLFYKNKDIKYILINTNNGNKILEFIDIIKLNNDEEGIVLKSPITELIKKENIFYTNFILKGRFETDDLILSYKNNNIISANINFKKIIGVE